MSKQKNIRVIATKLTGSLHLSKNKTCQDYFKYDINNDRIIAIVSDGAGSAQYGKIGAKVICEAIVNNLINSKTKNLKKDIKQSINNARDKLIKHRLNKSKTDTEISLFSATFVGVVYEKNSGFFFHIGDGAGIAVHDDNCHSYTISSPMNGQYSCETFFLYYA